MRAFAFGLFVLLFAASSNAETIWDRAKLGDRTEERLTRQSVERVLLGRGEERDLLRVRVGIITLFRGEIDDPGTIVLLLRLRREMGLSSAQRSASLLDQALAGDLSLTERAWAHLEYAHHALGQNELERAQRELDRSVRLAWRSPLRAETLILRGFTLLRSGRETPALLDFQAVQNLVVSRRLHLQAQLGQAVAYVLRGDRQRADAMAREAYLTESTRASVSRMDPFWDVPLPESETQTVRALLLWGEALVRASQRDSSEGKVRLQACSTIRKASALSPQETETGAPTQFGWGPRAASAIEAMWAEECQEAVESASANDEDDL